MSEQFTNAKNQLAEMLLRHPVSGCKMFFNSEPKLNKDGSYTIVLASFDGSKKIQHTILTEEL